MFADPQTITVNSVAKAMNRINQDRYSSEYLLRSAADEFRLTIRNSSYSNRRHGNAIFDRHNVEFCQTVFPTGAGTTSLIRKAYLVFENQRGDTLVDPVNVTLGLVGFCNNTNLTKMANFES